METKEHSVTDISFVIISWNARQTIEKCVFSYAAALEQEGVRGEFIVVDNGSHDGTPELLEQNIFPRLPPLCRGHIIRLPKNIGTTKSRNLGLKKIRGRFCVICDSDTEFVQGSWKQAMGYLDADREIGILAGHLFFADRSTQHSARRFPTLPDKLLKLRKIFLGMRESTTDQYGDFPWDTPREVDTAIAAFWMFRASLCTRVGLLDERIFYSPEDLDFCLRVWQAGQKVLFYPGLEIIHNMRRISHANPFGYIAWSHFCDLFYYFRKHRYWFSRAKLYRRLGRTPT